MNRLLIINPGSTSTKISVFDDANCLFTESVFHDAPVLLQYPTTNAQMPFRAQVIRDILKKHDIDIKSINVWVGRGGCAYSQKSGVMEIDENLVRDTYKDVPDSDITDRDMISKKKQIKAMGRYGHLGMPRLATKELGEMLNDNCIDSIADAVIKFYNRDGYEKYGNYTLYKIFPLHIGFLPLIGRVKRKKVTE